MALTDIFTMIKSDKYTADGREELNKARKAEVEDRTYQIGEISEKTGLQKTAQGWKPPIYESDNPNQKNNRYRVDTGTHADYFNTLEEAKTFAEKHHRGDAGMPGREYPVLKKEDHIKLAKEVLSNTSATDPGWTAEEIAKEWRLGEADAEEVKKEFDNLRKGSSGNKSAESKPGTKNKPTMQQYMKAKQDIKKFEDTFKKQNEQYEARQRMGEGASAMSPLWGLKPNDYKNDPEYKKAAELVKAFEAEDSAPRILTGDCKVRIRK